MAQLAEILGSNPTISKILSILFMSVIEKTKKEIKRHGIEWPVFLNGKISWVVLMLKAEVTSNFKSVNAETQQLSVSGCDLAK